MKTEPAGGKPSIPIKMWQAKDKEHPSLTATCCYARPSFTVTVRHTSGARKSGRFPSMHEPIWGMDVEDMAASMELAAKLADQLVAKLGLKGPAHGKEDINAS